MATSDNARLLVKVLALVLLLSVPLLLGIAFDLSATLIAAATMGLLTGSLSRFFGNQYVGLLAVGVAALITVAAGYVFEWPVAFGVLFAVVGAGIAATARSGLFSAMNIAAISPAFLVLPTGDAQLTWQRAGLLLACGLWAVLVLSILSRKNVIPMSKPKQPMTAGLPVYICTVAVLAGIGNWVFAHFQIPFGAWINLTIFVVALPNPRDSISRIQSRSLGTVIGAIVAWAIAIVIPWPALWALIAVVCLATMLVFMSKTYWVYAVFLTVAMVLLNGENTDGVLKADLYRLLLTVATGAMVYLVAWGLHVYVEPRYTSTNAPRPPTVRA